MCFQETSRYADPFQSLIDKNSVVEAIECPRCCMPIGFPLQIDAFAVKWARPLKDLMAALMLQDPCCSIQKVPKNELIKIRFRWP